MSKAKFEAARELIQEKRYDEARTILRTIDHPLALDWLSKIDKIDPPSVTAGPINPSIQPAPAAAKRQGSWKTVLAILLITVAAGTGFLLLLSGQTASNVAAEMTRFVAATATGTLLPVPPALPEGELNRVINKCLGEVYKNRGMYQNFTDSMGEKEKADDFRSIGSTSRIYMGDYCAMSEGFQVAWVDYSEISEKALKNKMDKSSAWATFIVGWEGVGRMYTEQTATMAAYRAAQPTELMATVAP